MTDRQIPECTLASVSILSLSEPGSGLDLEISGTETMPDTEWEEVNANGTPPVPMRVREPWSVDYQRRVPVNRCNSRFGMAIGIG